VTQELQHKNLKGVAVAFHSIKGVASTMGANLLAMRAAEFEQKFNSPDIADERKVIAQDTLNELNELLEKSVVQLENAFKQYSDNKQDTPDEKANTKNLLSPAEWKKQLSDVLPSLIADDLAANDLLEALYDASSAEDKARLEDLRVQVNALQYETAIVTIKHIIG
jgi:HPt (histidine-containing phosphotransfer) domain-containing protein